MSVYSKTEPCARFVFVRNVHCLHNFEQAKGDFDTDVKDPVLSANGYYMSKAFEKLPEYYLNRTSCDPIGPEICVANVWVDKGRRHAETSKFVPIKYVSHKTLDFTPQDIEENLGQFMPFREKINVNFVFTDSKTISNWLKDLGIRNIGVPLASCTVVDYLKDGTHFVHEIGSLAALQYGGYDSSTVKMWNNSK